jgi:hypothetical protein
MNNYVFVFEPEKCLYDLISELKERAKAIAGPQQYLDDPPHLTFYLASFEEDFAIHREAPDKINKTIARLRAEGIDRRIELIDWLVFPSDPITRKETLACKIADQDKDKLRKIQTELVMQLDKYRAAVTPKRYSEAYERLSPEMKRNVDQYGYPFVGKIWEPHFSIASFEPSSFEKVKKKIYNNCPKGHFNLERVVAYLLSDETDSLTEVTEIRL